MTATVRGIKFGREGSRTTKAREYSVIYKVYTDDRRDGVNQVLSAFGMPSIGDIFVAGNETDATAAVIRKQARQLDTPFEWEVEVEYSTDFEQDPNENTDTTDNNPLYEPPDISYGSQARRVLIPGRYNDPLGPPGDKAWQQGIFLPNGELFDPPPEMELYEPIVSIRRNVQSISGPNFMALSNCVNFDNFQNAEPRQLKMTVSAERRWHQVCGYFWEAQFNMVFRWETWDVQLLNQGTYYFAGGKPSGVWATSALQTGIPFKDVAGNFKTGNLSTNGDQNTTDTPTFTRLRVYREINFGALNLLGSGPISI